MAAYVLSASGGELFISFGTGRLDVGGVDAGGSGVGGG
jgi:hypothetical protein